MEKRLVKIEVHHVDAEISGPHDAHQRVHVGAVHVQHGALLVQNLRHLGDVLFEHPERVGIGAHQAGDVAIHDLFERPHVEYAGFRWI